MKCITGTFNGTGADLFIGLGFVPDKVIVRDITTAAGPSLIWTKNMRIAAMTEGLLDTDGTTTLASQVAGAGIQPYEGGIQLTSALQTSTGFGEGVYLVKNTNDWRYGINSKPGPNQGSGDAVADTIDTWTLDTAGNRTGHFNEDVTGDYIGAGSPIHIETGYGRIKIIEKLYIESLTATQGEAADEVTLSRSVVAGRVRYIGAKYDYVPQVVGQTIFAGFKLSMTTPINVNDEVQYFEAYLFDD